MSDSKFKYFLSPENIYVIDYGDISVQVSGAQIMAQIRRSVLAERMFSDYDDGSNPTSDDHEELHPLQ